MSGRVHKKIRKTADKRVKAILREIGRLPFRRRLWFAWRILKGAGK